MRYEKPVVRKIIFNNEDILAASPHKCTLGPNASDDCANVGRVCSLLVEQTIGGCKRTFLFGTLCDQEIGANSVDPTESI